MRMSKTLLLAALLVCVVSVGVGDDVDPATLSVTNVRGEAEATLSGSYFRGTTLVFTNCLCLTADGISTQGLADVSVEVRVGNTTYNTAYNATEYDINGDGVTNAWFVSITVPTNVTATCLVQTKLTDASTNVFIYPRKRLTHVQPLE